MRLNADVIIAPTTVEVRAAKGATKLIPIVFYNVPDPVGSGLVTNLARPGGNVTGFNTVNHSRRPTAGKLKETIPKLPPWRTVDTKNPASAEQWKEARASPAIRVSWHSMEVSSADKYETAFRDAVKARMAQS